MLGDALRHLHPLNEGRRSVGAQMISRQEFHLALSLALAALSPPLPEEAPLVGEGKPGLDNVCFDFWPGSLRIVGTNGRRMVVVYCAIAGLPQAGKFLMPTAAAQDAMWAFAPISNTDDRRVSLQLFGLESMIITSGEAAQMVQGSHGVMYPEYHLLLTGDTLPIKGAIFDMGTLTWVLSNAALAGNGAVQLQVRAHGPTVIRPKLREFETITDVIFAIKPLALAT